MKCCRARAAAAALAVAALLPGPARPDGLAEAEAGVERTEELLRAVDQGARSQDETAADRAALRFSTGETQYLLGDWSHAALLLGQALEDASFRQGPQGNTATFYLGDALRHAGACGAARPHLADYLRSGEPAHRGEALAAAVECASRLDRGEEVGPLLAEAEKYHQGQLPPDLRYLFAKHAAGRADLPPEDRFRAADPALAAVGAPYAQQAAYLQAVLRIDRGDLAGAAERFGACAELPTVDARQREVQDLCTLGLARVRAEAGDLPGAVAAYDKLPIDSPYFEESLYEAASVHGRAGQLEPALRAAETLLEISPDSPLTGRSLLLQGQLLRKQGKYEPATQAYGQVIGAYGRARDDLDAVLTLHQDPARYFAELLWQRGRPGELAPALPATALQAALARPEMARASGLVQALEEEAHDLEESASASARIGAVLQRRGGVDAFPRLRQGWAGVQAVQNAVAVHQGAAATAALEAVQGALGPEAQAELTQVHGERLVLEARLDALPRTAEAARARLDRQRARLDGLDRQAFQMGYDVESARAAAAATEVWLETHRADPTAAEARRAGFAAELRKHREVVAGYEAELKALRLEIAKARDAAGGAEALDEETRLRGEYLELLARERTFLDGARGKLSGVSRARFERALAVADRLGGVSARADALGEWIAGEARRRSAALQAQLSAEQGTLQEQEAALKALRAEARGTVGQVAYRSFGAVRQELYGLVLQADVGLNDVAWTRKRDRVEQIQKLSMQQAEELRALDQRYKPMLKEEE